MNRSSEHIAGSMPRSSGLQVLESETMLLKKPVDAHVQPMGAALIWSLDRIIS
jgi:hypothetical protein